MPLLAADLRVAKDRPYAEPASEKQTLDVYAPAEGKDHPIVFWIHGGGWQAGNKAEVAAKPQAFVDRGYVFVSTNYRLLPQATIGQMAEDVAKGIRWTRLRWWRSSLVSSEEDDRASCQALPEGRIRLSRRVLDTWCER